MRLLDGLPQKRIRGMLLDAKLITEEQWQKALEQQQKDSRRIEDILLEQKLITPQHLAILTSLQQGIPYVSLSKQSIDLEGLQLIPESVAREYCIAPLKVADGVLVIAMEDPGDAQLLSDLAALTRKRIEPVIATRQEIEDAIALNYRASGEIEKQLSQITMQTRRRGGLESQFSTDSVAHAPIVRAVDLLLSQAVRDRASDIHIEPQEDRLRIRYRIDGILHDVMTLPLDIHPALISRLKIMAGMNIAERRRPQDGQISFPHENREIDIRVAIVNTIYGEMAVLRILDKSFALLSLEELGFRTETLENYKRMLKSPFGMILITGPTGSGKTTTIYGSINLLDSIGRNIITIEDPVEYRFANINQLQVNPAAGLTFATGLRAILRLDPNIILVGEIRDPETAQIAIQAALTGHLVLSSVHANDSVSAILRLTDLGVEPFLVSAAVVGIVAQRMVRRLCTSCSRLTTVTSEERIAYEEELGVKREEFLYGAGCNACAGTGYSGRSGIFEVLTVSEEIRRLILTGAGTDKLRAQASQEGTTSLWREGMLTVKAGITTPYEVIRNVFSVG